MSFQYLLKLEKIMDDLEKKIGKQDLETRKIIFEHIEDAWIEGRLSANV